jgi:transposase
MIRPSGDVRIHLYRQPVDMRMAINGLVSIVEGEMGSDPFSADLYILCNRARTLVKMVAWEGNGFVLWMKRLEKSRFKWPLSGSDSVLQLTVQEINWLLDGYPLTVTQANGSLPHRRVL